MRIRFEVITYTDKNGRVVLKRSQAPGNTWADTYYIYNDFGGLVAVIPPEAVSKINASSANYHTAPDDITRDNFLKLWAFRYRYDKRLRMIMKQVPGAEPVYMIYDDRDRLVMTQDGNQRDPALPMKEWTFTKYDFLNRPILTGKYNSNNNQDSMQTAVNNYYSEITAGEAWFETYEGPTGDVLGYSNSSFPLVSSSADYYTAAYYDLYDSYLAPAGFTYLNESIPGQEPSPFLRTLGLATVSLVKNLSAGTFLRTVNYYDHRHRIIQTVTDHQKGTVRTSNVYDFSGKLLTSKRTYIVNNITTTIKEKYSYDHARRLINVNHSSNGATDVMIVKNEYNELGQLIDKKLHSIDGGTTFQQSVDHRYNIRGWLTKINEPDVSGLVAGDPAYDYFGMQLTYDKTLTGLSTTQMFNGNISAIQWSKGNGGSVGKQAYTYTYDPLNRLKEASHFDYSVAGWESYGKSYQEKIDEYDLNGNIIKLTRRGFGGLIMDSLHYAYNANKLLNDFGNQTDGFVNTNTGTDDYDYDYNGNLDKDKNKGLLNKGSIRYNHLNLPKEIIKGAETMKYIYDANGRKLAQEVYSNSGATLVKYTDYIGEMVFEGDTLKFFHHADGRVLPDGAGWEYQYHIKDHLGNVRVTFTTKPQSPVNYVANLETGTANSGETIFGNYTSTNYDLVDHTDPAGTTYTRVQWLNGGASGRVGLTKSLSVMPGDRVSVTAYAKYMNLTGSGNPNAFATALTAAFGVSAGSSGEQLKLYNSLNDYGLSVAGGDHPADDDTAPKAFVTILLFDRNFNLLDAAWDQINSADGEQGSATVKEPPHDELFREVTVQEPGYAYIFMSNEHPTYVDVYFDDVSVGHVISPIISSSDYFPFGMTFNSHQRENSFDQKYLYNGKEIQDELALGWMDYGARMYMPEIGRWGAVDGLAENSITMTPYHYAANNPIVFIDLNGLDWFYYRKEGQEEASWNWHEGSEYKHTYSYKNKDGKEVTESTTLQGAEAVIVFDGFTKEKLGTKEGHKPGKNNKSNQYMDSEGSITAKVTVYGPKGPKDIAHYTGYTNSSDPDAFGVVADGTHDGKFVTPGKSGSLESNFWLRGEVPARFGRNPAFPKRVPGFLDAVYIHSHNQDGWAGTWNSEGFYKGVSQGCLLIARSQWNSFKAQLNGVQDFKVQIKRTIHPTTIDAFIKMAFPNYNPQ